MKTVYNKTHKSIILKEEINKGGEGTIYSVDANTVAKVYHPKSLTTEKEAKIKAILSKKINFEGICAPIESIFNDNGKFIGYLMPKAKAEKGYELQTCIFNPALLKNKLPDWTRVNLANLSIVILEKIKYLHDKGIIIGDINPFNILIKDEKTVFFVDVDSYQVENFTCPVGTVHFTAPEIQDINSYNNLIRTKEHEYFAAATLLFMIFHAGKTPYSFQGGGNMKDNIKSMNFSFPLGDEDNYLAPQGMWEFIWSELSYEIRKAFYTVFKENIRIDIENWLNIISTYRSDLVDGIYPKNIFPDSTEKIIQGRTINMNRRDIKENDPFVRNGKTELRPKSLNPNIGVLELSTKAVKFLTADQKSIKELGFSYDYFFRLTDKTETGRGLDDNNIMDIEYYTEHVIPYINKMIRNARDKKVDTLYSVATAAYRTANNREELIDLIRNKCGVNVKVLSKKEEAIATLTAFIFSKKNNIVLNPNLNYLMLDQGGGSTELSLFKSGDIIDSYSLNLGTTVLKNVFFKEANSKTQLDKCFKDSDKFIKDRIRTYFSNPKSSLLNKNKGGFIIANGTAITQATGKKGNPNQHCTLLSVEFIENVINQYQENLNSNFKNTLELFNVLEGPKSNTRDTLDRILVSRLGLPMFLELLKQLDIKHVCVNGTGLWYGIYFENLYNLNNQ